MIPVAFFNTELWIYAMVMGKSPNPIEPAPFIERERRLGKAERWKLI